MTIQNLNAVRAIARLAEQTGATLPAEITAATAHLEQLATVTPARPQPDLIAKDLSDFLGDPTGMAKAKRAAIADLAVADATARVDARLTEICGARLFARMRTQAATITAAIGATLEPDLAILQDQAGRLPEGFRTEQADQLDAATYAVWHQVRDAYARITATHAGLGPLYASAVAGDLAALFTFGALPTLRIAEPPAFDTPEDALAFASALEGTAVRPMGLASQGSPWISGAFIPTSVAHAGGTFSWATPKQVTERARAIYDAAAAQPVPVPVTQRSIAW